jgi:hypothetical protein
MEKKREDGRTIQTSIAIDIETHRRLTELARRGGMSMSDAATHAIAVLWANSSFYWSASKQTELLINREPIAAGSSMTVSKSDVSNSKHDPIKQRSLAWVASMVHRVCSDLVSSCESDPSFKANAENALNREAYKCARYHGHLPDSFAEEFTSVGVECGINAQRSSEIVAKAIRDAAKNPAAIPGPSRNRTPDRN